MSHQTSQPWDLSRLQTFLCVVNEGSLTRAASLLGKPQPAISRQIARLEQECGGRLLLRTGRGVELSALGERLLPRISAIFKEVQELTAEVEQRAHVLSGEVRLGSMASLQSSIVLPVYEQIRQRHPGLRLRVFEGSAGQIDQWLVSGFVDIGLSYHYGGKADSRIEALENVASYLIGPAGDELTQAPTVPFAKLDNLPLILAGKPSAMRLLLDQLARKSNVTLNVVMEADSTQLQRALVARACGYAVLPAHVVTSELASGILQASKIVDPTIHRDITMEITTARPATQATREVANNIRQLHRKSGMPDLA